MGPVPLLLCLAGTAIVCGVLLYLLISLKMELWRMKKSIGEKHEALHQRCDTLAKSLAGMESVIREAEARAAVLVPPPTSRSGMNMNKRLQAARMSKRGERPEQIA